MKKKSAKAQKQVPVDILKQNKYFQTVLLAYYMLTRDIDIIKAAEKLKDPKLLSDLFEEYKRYVAGYDIDITVEGEENNTTFKVPDFTTIKTSTILQVLKKTPKL